jgi:cytochrome c biogenesis protein CcmG, thiol:disulfide interchange protein DsbE
MKKYVPFSFALFLAIAVVELAGCHSVAPAHGVNSPAADFSVQDINGQPLNLASYHGKVVLLNFWATWCTPCRGEIPNFVDFQNKYGPRGFTNIGISMDDDAKPVAAFYQQFKMNYPVAMGTEKLAQSYGGVLGLPVSFLIDRNGKIAAKYVGAAQIPVVEQEIQTLLASK